MPPAVPVARLSARPSPLAQGRDESASFDSETEAETRGIATASSFAGQAVRVAAEFIFQIKLAVEGLSTGFVVVSEVGMSRLNILPRVAGISHCDSRGPITPRRSASRDDSCNVPVNIFRWMPTASML